MEDAEPTQLANLTDPLLHPHDACAPKKGACMDNPMDLFLLTCRLSGELNGLTRPPGKDCLVGGEPGWILTCERCSKRSLYRRSEAGVGQFSWGPA
jgi:hypothetical protein